MNQKYTIKSPVSGNPDFDQIVSDYRDNLLTWGCTSRKEGDLIVMELINGVSLDINDFLFITSKDDGDVFFYNPFIEIEQSHIDDEIPEGLPNRIDTLTIDGVNSMERIHTWRTWRNSSYPLEKIGEYFYSVSCIFGNTLSSKELLIIHSTDGVRLIDKLPNKEI